MKIIICQDSYKGTLSAQKVVATIKKSLEIELEGKCEISCIPLADGGEGTSEIITQYFKGKTYEVPLNQSFSSVEKGQVSIVDNQAFIDVASASGLQLRPTVQTFFESSSYGTGELIKFALERECTKIHLCLGGSGINDAGIGVLNALGVQFLDKNQVPLEPRTKNLSQIDTLDFSKFKELKLVDFVFLTDVQNPLVGKYGATKIFASQKGATKEAIQLTENGMKNYIEVLQKLGFESQHDIQGAGAAGGISYSLATIIGGNYQSGIDFILQTVDLKNKLSKADVLIVGEGKYDFQTTMGKVVEGVLNLSEEYDLLRILLAGAVQWDYQNFQNPLIDFVQSTITENQSIEDIIERAEKNLESASKNIGKILRKIKFEGID